MFLLKLTLTFVLINSIICLSTKLTKFKSSEYAAIQNLEVLKVSGDPVLINSLWKSNDKALMVLFRSFG